MPHSANTVLTLLAKLRGVRKWEVVRAALLEYAEQHVSEINGAGTQLPTNAPQQRRTLHD
jgi:hypothetical protein